MKPDFIPPEDSYEMTPAAGSPRRKSSRNESTSVNSSGTAWTVTALSIGGADGQRQ